MIRVVKVECGPRQGVVVIRADGQEEALSSDAKNLAITEAARAGLPRPGLSGNDSPYPVDANGNTGEDVLMGRVPVAGYQCDYRLTGGV